VLHPDVEPWPGDRVEPFSKIRKITADHMIMSRRVSAHVTSYFEIDYSRIAELRKQHKAPYAERGVNLTYLAFIAKAGAETLRAHPVVNAAVSGDNIIYRRDVNIGIAVALDWGLIGPDWRAPSTIWASERGPRSSSPTRSSAARSPSRTPACSVRTRASRSSINRRWRFSVSARLRNAPRW
jgi:hypothetical protein